MRPRRRASWLALWGQGARALLRYKGRSALTAVGIAIAISSVVWVVAIAKEGAARYAALLQGLGDNLVWVEAGARNAAGVRSGSKSATTLTLGDMEAIAREVPFIRHISPQVDGTVQLESIHGNWGTRSRGVAADYLTIKRFSIASGRGWTDDDLQTARNVVLLGQTVRERLFEEDDPVGQVIRVNGRPFEVIGVLAPKGPSATGQDQDDVVMVPYTTAIKKMRSASITWLDDIVCSADAAENVARAAQLITGLMRERHHIGLDQEDDFNIRHPEEVVKAQLAASNTLSNLLVAVGLVSLLVGGIGIMNVMLASVTERTREIGVRLALGATQGAIIFQFLSEAVMLCLLGAVGGLLVSVGGASAIGSSLAWKLTIPLDAVFLAVVVSVGVGLLFGFLPARRASKMDPLTALRDE